tara:strand:+ start:271 stop:612 length:342 start_codon:yes stop_codon:yes gene_type:complete
MSFKEGNQYGKLSKRGEGKINSVVKTKLTALMDNIIDDIDIEMLTTNQKFKLLDMCLQYSIPKMVYKAELSKSENPEKVTVTVLDSNGKITANGLDETDAGLMQDMDKIIWGD